MAVDFDFHGIFRVQSRKSGRSGRIAGNWFTNGEGVISSDDLNRTLARNTHWSGVPVNLRPAIMTKREGIFHDVLDNLYKMECYDPLDGGDPFPCHIIDVTKAVAQWHERWPLVSSLFVEGHAADLARVINDLETVIANEYYCHEAGHVLGRSVQTKTGKAYFSPGDRVRWPLIWVEEFRADLHSYSVALDLLRPQAAVAVFVYNCLARWAGDALSMKNQAYGYGPIPFLLFNLLLDLRFLTLVKSKSKLKAAISKPSMDELVNTMNHCHLHALSEFTEVELTTEDPLEWGINAARYYRERVLRNPGREDYLELLSTMRSSSVSISYV
jgi:hypothetical protein